MTSIEAGKLDRKILIQSFTTVDQPSGFPLKSWTNKSYHWAAVRREKGGEAAKFSREESATFSMVFQIRYDDAISVKDRIVFDGYNWRIRTLTPWGRLNREVLEITADVVDADQVIE